MGPKRRGSSRRAHNKVQSGVELAAEVAPLDTWTPSISAEVNTADALNADFKDSSEVNVEQEQEEVSQKTSTDMDSNVQMAAQAFSEEVISRKCGKGSVRGGRGSHNRRKSSRVTPALTTEAVSKTDDVSSEIIDPLETNFTPNQSIELSNSNDESSVKRNSSRSRGSRKRGTGARKIDVEESTPAIPETNQRGGSSKRARGAVKRGRAKGGRGKALQITVEKAEDTSLEDVDGGEKEMESQKSSDDHTAELLSNSVENESEGETNTQGEKIEWILTPDSSKGKIVFRCLRKSLSGNEDTLTSPNSAKTRRTKRNSVNKKFLSDSASVSLNDSTVSESLNNSASCSQLTEALGIIEQEQVATTGQGETSVSEAEIPERESNSDEMILEAVEPVETIAVVKKSRKGKKKQESEKIEAPDITESSEKEKSEKPKRTRKKKPVEEEEKPARAIAKTRSRRGAGSKAQNKPPEAEISSSVIKEVAELDNVVVSETQSIEYSEQSNNIIQNAAGILPTESAGNDNLTEKNIGLDVELKDNFVVSEVGKESSSVSTLDVALENTNVSELGEKSLCKEAEETSSAKEDESLYIPCSSAEGNTSVDRTDDNVRNCSVVVKDIVQDPKTVKQDVSEVDLAGSKENIESSAKECLIVASQPSDIPPLTRVSTDQSDGVLKSPNRGSISLVKSPHSGAKGESISLDSSNVGDIPLKKRWAVRSRPWFGASKSDIYIGSHVSSTVDLSEAIRAAKRVQARAVGVFLRRQNEWISVELDDEDVKQFKAAARDCDIKAGHILPHGSYMLNCGSEDPERLRLSRNLLVDDLQRCQLLNLHLYNFHPGYYKSGSLDDSIGRIADSINYAHARSTGVITVIENTCGGTGKVGGKFEHLKQIIDLVADKSRIGVCVNTCHAFAAGYDIRSESGYDSMMSELDDIIGFKYLMAVHANDSKEGCNSHVDHHACIGSGHIGRDCFRLLVNDRRLENIPIILETPTPSHAEEIKTLYDLIE